MTTLAQDYTDLINMLTQNLEHGLHGDKLKMVAPENLALLLDRMKSNIETECKVKILVRFEVE